MRSSAAAAVCRCRGRCGRAPRPRGRPVRDARLRRCRRVARYPPPLGRARPIWLVSPAARAGKAAATSFSSAAWCGRLCRNCGSISATLKILPADHGVVSAAATTICCRACSRVMEQAWLPRARGTRARPGDSRARRRRSVACAPSDRDRGRHRARTCADRRDRPFRRRPGRRRRRQSRAGGRGGRRHRSMLDSVRRRCDARAASGAREASAFWSRRRNPIRTGVSIFPASGRKPLKASRVRVSPARGRRRRGRSLPNPRRSSQAADRAGLFVIGMPADGNVR